MNTNIVYRLDIVSIAPKIFPELNPKVGSFSIVVGA